MLKKEIIHLVKNKKELSDLPDSLVLEVIEKILNTYKKNAEELNNSDIKILIKETREYLRKRTGMFQIGKKDRFSLLEEGKIEDILRTHSSTLERISVYPEIIKIIENINP